MANFRYTHPDDNVAPDATLTTTMTENSAYPLTRMTDFGFEFLSAPALFAETSGIVLAEWAAAQRIDYLLLWTNWQAGLAYSVQMNATNSWGAPTLDYSGTAPAKRANRYTRKIGIDLTAVAGYASGPFPWLRINVTGTNDVPVGFKFMAFSQMRTTTRNIKWGYDFDRHIFNIRQRTDAGYPWNYNLQSAPRTLRASIEPNDADDDAIDEWMLACGGSAAPTVVVKDWPTGEPFLGLFGDGNMGATGAALDTLKSASRHDFLNRHTRTLLLDEITAGDPEWY